MSEKANIEAIRKAAEACINDVIRVQVPKQPIVWADDVDDVLIDIDAQFVKMLDPATVLELCRLAEIGERHDGICKWQVDEDEGCVWETECGAALYFDAGSPKENGVKFCNRCGKTMIQEPPK